MRTPVGFHGEREWSSVLAWRVESVVRSWNERKRKESCERERYVRISWNEKRKEREKERELHGEIGPCVKRHPIFISIWSLLFALDALKRRNVLWGRETRGIVKALLV